MNYSDDRTSSQSKNSDSLPSNIEPIDNLLDILLDSESSQDSSSIEQAQTDIIEQSHTVLSEELSTVSDKQENDIKDDFVENSSSLEIEDNNSNNPDIDVEIEQQDDIALDKAVEYEAFLRQTVDPHAESLEIDKSNAGSLKQYDEALGIEVESASTEELAESVNTLIPLIVELLKYKIDDSQETILRGVTPIVERIIEQRSTEEPQKMAAAIAKILPFAIAENINLSPEEIAKAIAPELALSIKEQIRLDENAISEALGSEMGKAIKTQIEVEKDAMVDALYPVIGDTISKYMVEVVKEINSKVESTLSPEGFKRKIQARMRGVSEAELILQESVGCHVQAVFLIDKDSGLIIQEARKFGEQELESDMLGGMLTAIRSFANDCIVSGSELDSIDYGNWQIHLEVAGYCYLAIILKGEPNKSFINRVRQIFGDIILNYGNHVSLFDGNLETVPIEIKPKLEQLIEPEIKQPKKTSSSKTLLWLLAFFVAIIVIPLSLTTYRSRIAQNIEHTAAIQLDAAPELSVYRLEPKVKRSKLTIQGRVPSEYLLAQAIIICQKIAEQNNLQLDNQIVAVDVPVNSSLLTGEISRLTHLFNQQSGILIETNYLARNLSIKGFVLDQAKEQSIIEAFSLIPGIKHTTINIADRLPSLPERIYFESSSNKVDLANNSSKIKFVIKFLNQYPTLNVKFQAYSDGVGSKQANQKLGMKRCSNLKDVLIAKGVEPSRLVSDCETHRISTRQPNQTVRLTRYVKFEPFIPTK